MMPWTNTACKSASCTPCILETGLERKSFYPPEA
jgi:hypothetical protein